MRREWQTVSFVQSKSFLFFQAASTSADGESRNYLDRSFVWSAPLVGGRETSPARDHRLEVEAGASTCIIDNRDRSPSEKAATNNIFMLGRSVEHYRFYRSAQWSLVAPTRA
ncbi:hypothetical protein LSAT2_006683 [Lamellibrachia satsuma]|nr:hypothetical protein LSAT2_006683 [Lamellibrachia satsuma]